MVKEIVKDPFFLGQKSAPATKDDLQVGRDLMDILKAHREGCVGMAANMREGKVRMRHACMKACERARDRVRKHEMIGVKKNIIIVNMGFIDVVMFNPIITSKSGPYQTEEGCLSLTGVRKTTRYQDIEVEYYDFAWKKQRQKLSGWTAQIAQHEIDHCNGIVI